MSKKLKIKFDILAIFCILLFCFSLTPITFQNDTYYTIAIGKHIIDTKTIDMQDPFSWHDNLPYTYPHWAYDVATYLIYQTGENIGIGGFCALYITTVLLAAALGIVLYYTIDKLSKNKLVALFITFAIMYLLKNFIAARAQLVTFILFTLTILFIEQFIETKKKRYAIYLVTIPILIANVHCAVWPFYFVLYLPYIAEYLLGVICDAHPYYLTKIWINKLKIKKLLKQGKTEQVGEYQESIARLQLEKEKSAQKQNKRRNKPYKIIFTKKPMVKWLIVVMTICIFTGFLTPIGMSPYTYLIKTMQGNTMSHISEHQPLTLINNIPMLIALAIYIALLAFTDTKVKLCDLFMIGGLTLLTFMSRRQASIFVIVCGIIFARLVTNFLEKYDKSGTKDIIEIMTSILGKTVTILIVILLSAVMYKGKIKDHFIDVNTYPVEAATYILENLDVNTIHLFNEYNYGSYLLYRNIPVFIDSRADLYTPQFNGTKNEKGKYEGKDIFSDYTSTTNINSYYEDQFEKYDITHVILKKKTKLNMLISKDENYKEIYSDDNFVIYDRLVK